MKFRVTDREREKQRSKEVIYPLVYFSNVPSDFLGLGQAKTRNLDPYPGYPHGRVGAQESE